jgi:hypothetical protein
MPKYALLSQLNKSKRLLENRRDMIPKYVNQPGNWTNGNPYSMDMIPKIQFQIDEMKAAIRGIEQWKKENLKKKC